MFQSILCYGSLRESQVSCSGLRKHLRTGTGPPRTPSPGSGHLCGTLLHATDHMISCCGGVGSDVPWVAVSMLWRSFRCAPEHLVSRRDPDHCACRHEASRARLHGRRPPARIRSSVCQLLGTGLKSFSVVPPERGSRGITARPRMGDSPFYPANGNRMAVLPPYGHCSMPGCTGYHRLRFFNYSPKMNINLPVCSGGANARERRDRFSRRRDRPLC